MNTQSKLNLYLFVFISIVLLSVMPAFGQESQGPAAAEEIEEESELPVVSYFKPPANALITDTRVKYPDQVPGNIRLGPLHVHPYLTVKQDYTDNLFLRKGDNDTSDFINTVSPGILLLLPFLKESLFQIEYKADLLSYSKYTQYNTQDQMLNALLNFSFADRLNIKVGNDYIRTSTPPRDVTDVRNDYSLNSSFFETSYRFADRWMARGFYSYETRRFSPGSQSPQLDNYNKHNGNLTLFYRILPLTSILLEYGYSHKNNARENTDSNTQMVWAGIAWEPTEWIGGTMKGGYLDRRYDSPIPNSSTWGMRGDLKYRFRPDTTFTLNVYREPIDTSFAFKTFYYGTYYTETGAILSADHMITPTISAMADIAYWNDDFRQQGQANQRRMDDRWRLGLGLGYKPQEWLTFGVKYTNLNNSSNIDVESYNENRVMVFVSANF